MTAATIVVPLNVAIVILGGAAVLSLLATVAGWFSKAPKGPKSSNPTKNNDIWKR